MKLNDEELKIVMSRGGRGGAKPKEIKQDYGNNKNNSARRVSNVEQRPRNEPKKQDAPKASLPPVVIRFTHYRRKLADRDNFATKWFTDGLVKNGLLLDDSPEEVEDFIHKQVKIEMWQEERTVIELIPEADFKPGKFQ